MARRGRKPKRAPKTRRSNSRKVTVHAHSRSPRGKNAGKPPVHVKRHSRRQPRR